MSVVFFWHANFQNWSFKSKLKKKKVNIALICVQLRPANEEFFC